MNNTTNIPALHPLPPTTPLIDTWGPAPWINPPAFYTIRTVMTGFSLWLSLFSLIDASQQSEDFGGFEYLTSWGVHGTSFSFLMMWLPYTFKWYNGWGDGQAAFPSFLINWAASWAVFH